MSDQDNHGSNAAAELEIPNSRSSRLLRVARLAAGVAGGAIAETSRQLGKGKRPEWKQLLLTPANAKRLTRQLSEMRGAAMKLGQILSMEGEALLPPELATILAQLRANATSMPATQLFETMDTALGANWQQQFDAFEMKPMASASIGQVHRAKLDGRELAVKVQYPGVASSIDSDVDNMATLLQLTRLVPSHIEIDTLLDETKTQLHQEADYQREASYLQRFSNALAEDSRYLVPAYYPVLSSKTVISMDFIDGMAIEELTRYSSSIRDRVMSNLLELTLRELFDWRMMQTDPNFANYRVQLDGDEPRIVLLDFGATREFGRSFSANYRKLAKAIIDGNDTALLQATDALGYAVAEASDEYRQLVLDVFYVALEPLRFDEDYDFAAAELPLRIAELAQEGNKHRDFWQTPPTDALFLHRKLGGMFMLAERLGAKVNVHRLIKEKIRHVRLDKAS